MAGSKQVEFVVSWSGRACPVLEVMMFAVVAVATIQFMHPTSQVSDHDAVDVVLLETCGATAASRALDARIEAGMVADEVGRHRRELTEIRSVARMTPCTQDLRRRAADLLDRLDAVR